MKQQDDAVAVLYEFFDQMKKWEAYAQALDKAVEKKRRTEREAVRLIFQRLQRIFSRYCSGRPKWQDHKHYGEPPEYDPETELVDKVEVSGDSAHVTTMNHSWFREGEVNIYSLVRVNTKWRIDHRKQLEASGRKTTIDL